MKNVLFAKVLAAATVPALLFAAATVVSVGSLTVGQGAAVAEASYLPNSRLVSSNVPIGRRGQTVTWTVRLTANGHPVPNCPLAVTWRSDARGTTALAPVMTDANGYARISYTISTNVRDDNIILGAVSGGGPFTAVASQRISITR